MPTVEVEILRGTVAGGVAVEPGQVVTVSAAEAETLIRLRKAKPVTPEAETTSAEPEAEAAVTPKRKRGEYAAGVGDGANGRAVDAE